MPQIWGINAVLEALRSDLKVSHVFFTKETGQRREEILSIAEKKGVPVSVLSREDFLRRFGKDKQWVVALTEEPAIEEDDFVEGLQGTPSEIVLFLDEIQDPHNLGAILRTAEASGVRDVAITLHQSAPLSPAVFKASAGAISYLRLTMVKSTFRFLERLKEKGFWIAGTDAKKGKNIFQAELNYPLVLILGSERKGIRPLLMERCDYLLKIPMFGKVNSLNVSVASGIILFELRRAQLFKGLLETSP